jgi:hypothetical protein
MEKQTMTRREVINFLGIKLPVVLLAVEVLPGIARAEQSYTQMTFLAAPSERTQILDEAAVGGQSFNVEAARDEKGNLVGARFLDMDEHFQEMSHLKPGTIVYKINDKPFVFQTPKEFDAWQNSITEMIQKKQTITMDLDMDGEPYLYVFKFN